MYKQNLMVVSFNERLYYFLQKTHACMHVELLPWHLEWLFTSVIPDHSESEMVVGGLLKDQERQSAVVL